MKVLGIGGSTHDFCSCIVEDGKVIVAVEEERLSREKHSAGKSTHSKLGMRSTLFQGKQYCLNEMQIKETDLDLVVGNDMLNLLPDKIVNKNIGNILMINHHLAHAASSYYVSGFEESAIFVADCFGSFIKNDIKETITFGHATGKEISILKKVSGRASSFNDEQYYGNSLGDFYALVTRACGFGFLEDGKTMGLAPYGKNTYVKELWKYFILDNPLDIKIKIANNEINEFLSDIFKGKNENELFSIKADLAFAAQEILEECIFTLLNNLYEHTKSPRLCYTGGVALNSVLNGKIKIKTPFKEVFIQPASGDAGTAIGAALYGYYNILKQSYNIHNFKTVMKHAYLGKTYKDHEIKSAVNKHSGSIKWEILNNKQIAYEAARCISEGKIIGWFQGGSEIGPRSLGHRSILADACNKEMKDILNSRVKFRESFRPFAPSIMEEYANDYFDTDNCESPFMLMVYNVKKNKRDIIPAVTHVDGSARVQTINQETNDIFYNLLKCFYELTGVPLILNTSFNIKGEPIVETPDEALQCFMNTNIDVVFINNYIINKNKTTVS